jgi:hypothetical protein
MARIKKFAENLTQNLTTFLTFIVDDQPNSEYFRITEFKDTFTGGKNGFLIEGSEHLKESTEVKVQILDVAGDPIYYEPGDGIPEYYEGLSKLVSVHIYEDTPIGLGKITLLGELKTYVDDNGIVRDIPDEWKGVYNVKWERTFQINKNLSNEDRVRFYRRPKVTIDEIVKPIFSNVVTSVTQTGSAYGIPQIPLEGENLTNFSLPTSYLVQTDGNTFWTGSMSGNTITFIDLGFSTTLNDIINTTDATLAVPYSVNGLVDNFEDEPYTITFNHLEGLDNLKTALTGSFAKINILDLTTFVGDVARVKIFRRSQSQLADYEFVEEIQIESNEILRDIETTTVNQLNYGIFEETTFKQYWVTSSNNLTSEINQSFLYNSVKLDSIGTNTFFTTQSFDIYEGSEYTLTFNIRKAANSNPNDYIKVFLGGTPGPVLEDTSGAIACSTTATYNGGESYPTSQSINLGENTGNTNLQYNAETVPDRFIVEWDGNVVIDTGYVGGSQYDFGGASRSTFTGGFVGRIDPITGNSYPDFTTYPNDGYPIVTSSSPPLLPGSGSTDFNKTTSSPQLATLKVYAPLAGTAWNATLNCPQTPPVSGVEYISNPTDIQNIVTVTSDNSILRKSQVTANFLAENIDDVRLYFEVVGDGWYISDVSLRASQETAFSPDEITFLQFVPRTLPAETFDFLFQFYDINNNYVPVLVEETKTFEGGNLNAIQKRLELIPSANYFQFDSGSGNGNPIPPTTIFIDVVKEFLTGSVTFTSRSFDFFNNELSSSQYSLTPTPGYSWWKFPGQLEDINTDRPYLTVQNFTGSRDLSLEEIVVQYIEYTGECEGVTDSIVITRVLDGKGGVNYELRPYNGIYIRNSEPSSSLEVQAIRIDGVNEINLRSNLPAGQSATQIHVQSGSTYITLEEADTSGFINGLQPGTTGSGELNYNAIFNRDSIDGQLTLYIIPSGSENPSASILTTLTLTDLQDGLDAGVVLYDADTFTINPRTQTQFTPTFSSATASFYRRGTFENPISCSFEVFPSMSINDDWIPEYFMYFVTHSCDPDISVVAYDEFGNIIPSRTIGEYVYNTSEQSKQLLTAFKYTEPWTTASVTVDKLFTIVPEGKPGDESIVFEVVPSSITLQSNSRGIVTDYAPSITDIRLKQGSRYLAFSSSAASDPFYSHGQFYIATESISSQNITPGNIHFTSSAGTVVNFFNDAVEYTASLIVSASSNMTNLSASVTYPLVIHPYYTSSIYTASVVVQYTKVLDGAPPIEFIINDLAVSLPADEVEYVTDYSNANTEIKVKEGGDYLTFTTQSEAPGSWRINSITPTNIQVIDISSSSYDTATVNFERFDYPFLSASALYNFTVYPYSLGPGHEYTSSVYERTQTFVKNVAAAGARSVTLTSTSETVIFDGDGLVVAPEGDIRLEAEVFGFTGSVWYQFFRDGFAYSPIQSEDFFEITSGDSTAPGEIATWRVDVRDGSDRALPFPPTSNQPVRAQAQITISGIKSGADVYNVFLTNENASIYGDLWEYNTTGSNTQIIATKASASLVHKQTFSTPVQDFLGNDIGSLGEYQVTIASISPWITLPGGLVSGSVVPTVNDVAAVGDILSWTDWGTNTNAEIVYRIDIENGRQNLFKTQSISVQYNSFGSYVGLLSNENTAVVYKVSGQLTTDGTGTTIRAFRGDDELSHVTSFTGGQTDAFGNTGYKDQYKVSIYSVSAHLDLAGSLVAGSTLSGDPASIGDLDGWSFPETNQKGEVVYQIEVEGRDTIYKAQSFSVVFEGNTGPGIVMRGQWNEYTDYIGEVETADFRRDAVIYPDPSGSSGITHYFMAISGSGPGTFDGQSNLVGPQEPPSPNNDTAYWKYLGEQDFFVAAKLAIFEESFVKNTINVGNNPGSSFANIVLAGGRTDPYIALGQSGTVGVSGDQTSPGVIGYDRPGIFMGMYGTAGTSFAVFSLKGQSGTNVMKWDGENLIISGSIFAEDGKIGGWEIGEDYLRADPIGVARTTFYATGNIELIGNTTTLTINDGLMDFFTSVPNTGITTYRGISFTNSEASLTPDVNVGSISGKMTQLGGMPGQQGSGDLRYTLALESEGAIRITGDEGHIIGSTFIGSDKNNNRCIFSEDGGSLKLGADIDNPDVITITTVDVDIKKSVNIFNPNATTALTVGQSPSGVTMNSLGQLVAGSYINCDSLEVGGGYGDPGLSISSNGNIETDGYIRAGGNITAFYSSDERLKLNLRTIENPLDKVLQIGGYTFDWDETKQNELKGHDVGVIAQQIKEVLPEVVTERKDGYLAVRYEKIVPLLIESIKELSEKVSKLEEKLKDK